MERVEERHSFTKGWGQVSIGMMEVVKQELIKILSIRNEMMWWRRINGKGCRPLSFAEVVAIEEVFKKYGITDIWDN